MRSSEWIKLCLMMFTRVSVPIADESWKTAYSFDSWLCAWHTRVISCVGLRFTINRLVAFVLSCAVIQMLSLCKEDKHTSFLLSSFSVLQPHHLSCCQLKELPSCFSWPGVAYPHYRMNFCGGCCYQNLISSFLLLCLVDVQLFLTVSTLQMTGSFAFHS